ncbi:unnamed protein product (macronuclear) [Paramecium tetraurelia]|uniref:Transmembrane protein n=1 Tax=Paramecium tetraurelia TaxID=5888 RepID=A0CU83_PARTE|nr:uncharacterized protein GSPATT00010549001 [Paramecium tetraurelia]CAK74350.1 unnamed protein product [Paramecium tetraurelia]|eukprot:XP_001441747.1 hypothetical protein (macronuclear) [Paramecium tetraurelia strain d4-2]
MYKFCKQIVKINQVPAILNKNINNDLAFKKDFELNSEIIILNQRIQNRDKHTDLYSSIFGGIIITIGVYAIYEVYFSKSEQQLKKLKFSAKCYCSSFYQRDLTYILNYINEMKTIEIKNTGFMIYLLSTLKHQINKSNYDNLCVIYEEVAKLLFTHEIYIKMYAQKYSQHFANLLDYAIANNLQLKEQLLLPSLIAYTNSSNILIEIQSLYILTQHKLQDSKHKDLFQIHYQKDISTEYVNTTELFDMLKSNRSLQDYDTFKSLYENSLQTEKHKLLKQAAQKQNLRL